MKKECRNCKHYFITFDRHTPYGCKVYQIKSARNPLQVIKSQLPAGSECLGFEPSERAILQEKNNGKKEYE